MSRLRPPCSQSHAQLAQSQHSVLTLEPLTAQREGKAATIRTAEYNLNNTRIYAPFDARVTNLTISQGAYAHAGQQVFTLIDTRIWWAVANFRETQLRHIKPGMHADVYVLSRPNVRYDGVVDSVGYGVQPDSTLVGTFGPGLARCAALAELGTPGDALSGAGTNSLRRRRNHSGSASQRWLSCVRKAPGRRSSNVCPGSDADGRLAAKRVGRGWGLVLGIPQE